MYPLKNKGQYLETILNITNQKYLDENMCVVTKIPTNINLIKINNKIITNATFKDNFNCDYIGVYNGLYFEFDAKETSKDEFNFNAIRKNQQQKLDLVTKNKGLAFIILYFSQYDDFYLISYSQLKEYIKANKKTIPRSWIISNCKELFLTNKLKLDYLKHFDHLINQIA
ncbi:Holliday junction resolvase RecU [Mycoplasma feriruminatoris]|uniref:Holliday junction resolvase RecU n=1 Tax=Mycoplasma feriruminatoris TaxID=1179777 RepID=A0AAQ3DSJ4_9MOLU|nr:Holliday junction resolvase RecU [Mycoplasma feriruminatoris]UKS54200.1 recombination U family protein [Mycoplasma feriruminatoris]WFQ91081.1 Holliday junction resolvase RecU [Mycoplasma feriruminatoris]WFQ91903.1 Holliday junction resolvase RecU [Mycoplasma feriruminatoris]WFQ92743.1 Holliday junction resolvase RecU [Mycoplasma feriruminatoris]WFQ93588.1 Holliday junction resolvase RecU [Mycoplasma feriruminatoris]